MLKIKLLPPDRFSVVVALDVSLTDTGIAALDIGINKVRLQHSIRSTFSDPERQFMIVQEIRDHLGNQPPCTAVVLEDHAFGRNTGKARTRAELIGMIKYTVLVDHSFNLFLVSPSALKKFMGCSSKKLSKDKNAMFEAASNKFKFVSSNDNIVDAYCLARYFIAQREGQRLPIIRHRPPSDFGLRFAGTCKR
jgi:hypothetical protein